MKPLILKSFLGLSLCLSSNSFGSSYVNNEEQNLTHFTQQQMQEKLSLYIDEHTLSLTREDWELSRQLFPNSEDITILDTLQKNYERPSKAFSPKADLAKLTTYAQKSEQMRGIHNIDHLTTKLYLAAFIEVPGERGGNALARRFASGQGLEPNPELASQLNSLYAPRF